MSFANRLIRQITSQQSKPANEAMAMPYRQHSGDNVLPNFPLFARLLSHAHHRPELTAIRAKNVSASYGRLCSDMIRVRRLIRMQQHAQSSKSLVQLRPTFYGLQCPGSYEFAIAFLAILACGGIVVPISPHAAENEIKHIVDTCNIYTVLSSQDSPPVIDGVKSVSISNYLNETAPDFEDISISCVDSLDSQGPGLAIFTSGTTGPPKACLLPREMLNAGSQVVSDHYELSSNDAVLHCLPVHHAAGILVSFLPYLLVGACVEFSTGSFDAAFVWSRWRDQTLTAFTGVPTMYSRLMQHYETSIASQPPYVLQGFRNGARSLRLLISGTSAMPQPLLAKWTALTGGKRILERYGTTEFSAIFLISPHDGHLVPSGSVGRAVPGVDVRLSGGNEGEILVKCPNMFKEYYGNEAATRDAHDENGYYKTGDIARKEGPYYFILGRASTDILKSGGYKISALDVEREILGLEYVSEVAVVGVADEEFGQRVAAAIVPKEGLSGSEIRLNRLRVDLRTKLAGYKMPTLLWVTSALPKNHMGKIQKIGLERDVFENPVYADDVQMWQKKVKAPHGGLRARL